MVVSVSFDLYGCIQAAVQPRSKDGVERMESYWYDVPRLEVIGREPVMERPNFDMGYVAEGRKGPADKPMKF